MYAQLTYEAYLLSPTVRICKQGQLIVKVIESIMRVTKVFLFESSLMCVTLCVCVFLCMHVPKGLGSFDCTHYHIIITMSTYEELEKNILIVCLLVLLFIKAFKHSS